MAQLRQAGLLQRRGVGHDWVDSVSRPDVAGLDPSVLDPPRREEVARCPRFDSLSEGPNAVFALEVQVHGRRSKPVELLEWHAEDGCGLLGGDAAVMPFGLTDGANGLTEGPQVLPHPLDA